MYNCVKTKGIDQKGSAINKKIFVGCMALLLFLTVLLFYYLFCSSLECCKFKCCKLKCCKEDYDRLDLLDSGDDSLRVMESNSDGDLLDFELEYIGTKINGGILSFYDSNDLDNNDLDDNDLDANNNYNNYNHYDDDL
tara:strand:+ start:110 stop:523 length:414 start_codon:yes stop_codon:yes gene_type:complete